ncbi:MAG: peptide chain release factor N(5)-glutamine methyltransferase [Bacteroidaceae bacterium]|nr:peptide chain release factor N(5)-glutamine methyltransferase [Bacteroidaceae bacterium]
MYRKIRQRLTASGMEEGEAKAIALLLLEKVCGMSVAEVLTGKPCDERDREQLESMAARIAQGEPVQYVLGETEFCGMTMHVEPGVLIPRKETEELVEWVVTSQEEQPLRVLDIGTGSGCIAIALAKRLTNAHVEAWDISEEALAIAKENAERNHEHVEFQRVDVMEESTLPFQDRFHLIVSNPPYICEEEAAEMEANVLHHEPRLALFVPNDDPLKFYRRIGMLGTQMLEDGGMLFFEINRRFGKEVAALLSGMGYRDVVLRKDAFGNDRMVKAIKGTGIRY